MKKIFLYSVLLSIMVTACKKKDENPSITVTASYPVIELANNGLFSVPLGGSLPTGSAFGSAFDTFYTAQGKGITNGQPTPLSIYLLNTAYYPDSFIHFNAVGLYAQVALAQNYYNFITYDTFFTAVTNFPRSGAPNLAGTWKQAGLIDSFNTTLTSLGNGYYSINNLFGTENYYGGGFPAILAELTDSTFAVFYTAQYFEYGYTFNGTLSLAPGDTTITYNTAVFNGPIVTYTKE